ncbi:hypothetical protein BGZ98_008378 [Dissophora globulifera]|nr:hypothetical protein BGZ98_008378 [Dissophora globulifera]
MDQFSPQRRAWIQTWGQHNVNTELSNVLKSGHAWDSVDPNQSTPIEAAGLLFVKLMQVTNRATSKIFDVEWSLRVGNVERTSYPTRSYKDNTGNTATMNEIFLFDVNEPFQLEMTVTGNPVPTKFGTMAGFSSHLQTLGQLDLSFCLETMDKSVRTYKLRRPIPEDSSKAFKSDCEVVVMIGLHVLEEPIEDRSWETEVLYQGFLTFMTRGGRMTSWKRYWAVLEGRTLKLYDAEYQLKRDVVGVVPLAYVQGVEPPDYDKVDVVANAFSILVDPNGVDMAEEALDQYQGNMGRRGEIQRAKMARRASQSLSRHSFESSMPPSPLDSEEGGSSTTGMIDARFVW